MRNTIYIALICSFLSSLSYAQTEPSLKEVFNQLGLTLDPADEVRDSGPTKGLFVKTGRKVEILLAAHYTSDKQDAVSGIRMGYYPFTETKPLRLLFQGGADTDGRASITGLPANPNGPYLFDPGDHPFAFFAQSAKFNPEFPADGETLSTQDSFNRKISRFVSDVHKARIYPYKTEYGVKPDWYVICWELSTDGDFQDLITVARGVRPVPSPDNKKKRITPIHHATIQTVAVLPISKSPVSDHH